MSEIDDFSKLKVADLKKLLKERGLPVSGSKSELVARLQELADNPEEAPEDDDVVPDVEGGDEEDEDELLGGLEDELIEEEDLKVETPVDPPKVEAEQEKPPVLQKQTSNKITGPEGTEKTEHTSMTNKPLLSLEARAQKFGGHSSLEAKKQSRAERFGLPTKPTTIKATESSKGVLAVNKSQAPVTSEDLEKLKKRSERFGLVTSTPLAKAETSVKLKARAERFGAIAPALASEESIEKLKSRASRFGGVVAPTLEKKEQNEMLLKRKSRFGLITGPDSGEKDEKKMKRAERFGLA